MLKPSAKDDGCWSERLRLGAMELRLEAPTPEPGRANDVRMTFVIESASGRVERSAHAIAPPESRFGGESVHEQLAELRASSPGLAAPVLGRFLVRGPADRQFIAFIEVESAATTTMSALSLIPLQDGTASHGAAAVLPQSFVEGAGDELRVWQDDFAESGIVSPGHGYLGRVCLRLDGSSWVPDFLAMRRPPPTGAEFAEVVRSLRASWPGCGNPECIGSAADLAQAMVEWIFSGNAKSAAQLLTAVLGDRPDDESAFRRLFARELSAHVAHLAAIRELNDGSLWGLSEAP